MRTLSIKTLTLVSMALLSGCASLRACDIRIGDTAPRRIAKDMKIPGKGVEGKCLPFAVSLSRKFKAAGIPARVIGYRWNALNGPLGDRYPHSGSHAVVAYQDAGRTYIMDNLSWQPVWVRDGEIGNIVQTFSGPDFKVQNARVVGNGG